MERLPSWVRFSLGLVVLSLSCYSEPEVRERESGNSWEPPQSGGAGIIRPGKAHIPGATEVKVQLHAVVYIDEGVLLDYEVAETTGSFQKGQRGRSDPIPKGSEDLVSACFANQDRLGCILYFDEQGKLDGVAVEDKAPVADLKAH